MVLWAAYRKEDATWVKEDQITHYITNPKPSRRNILHSISSFTDAVNRSLKMGVNEGCNITMNFRTDVFRFTTKELITPMVEDTYTK